MMDRRNFLATSGAGVGILSFLGIPALGTAFGKVDSDPVVIGPPAPALSKPIEWEWKKVETIDIEIHKYNEDERLIYHKTFNGTESWWDYDSSGNRIHVKNNVDGGYENWSEYNDDGNMIHHKNSHGYEEWKDYDIVGRLIHEKNTNGMEFWYELNEAGNTIKTTRKRSTVRKIIPSRG